MYVRRSGAWRRTCCVRTGRAVPVMFWLDGFEEPFDAVGGEGAVGTVPDEQHVLPAEPELAVGVLG